MKSIKAKILLTIKKKNEIVQGRPRRELKMLISLLCDTILHKHIKMVKYDYNIWMPRNITMSKSPIDEKYLQKIIATTQSIEGYAQASKDVIEKVQSLRKKHGIKVSVKR